MTNKPIELYFADTPNGWKISIMLEESKIPYKIIPVNIGKGDQFKPSFLRSIFFVLTPPLPEYPPNNPSDLITR